MSSDNLSATTFGHMLWDLIFLLFFYLFYNLKYMSQYIQSLPLWLSDLKGTWMYVSLPILCTLHQPLSEFQGAVSRCKTKAQKLKACQILCICQINIPRCSTEEILHLYSALPLHQFCISMRTRSSIVIHCLLMQVSPIIIASQ